MTPYVVKKGTVSLEEVEIFEKIRWIVINMSDIDLGLDEGGEEIILSCHILARALSKVFRLKYQDGYYLTCYQHCWLLTNRGNIIDPYPVGIASGPILVACDWLSPGERSYTSTSARKLRRDFGSNSFRRSVRRVERELARLLK